MLNPSPFKLSTSPIIYLEDEMTSVQEALLTAGVEDNKALAPAWRERPLRLAGRCLPLEPWVGVRVHPRLVQVDDGSAGIAILLDTPEIQDSFLDYIRPLQKSHCVSFDSTVSKSKSVKRLPRTI